MISMIEFQAKQGIPGVWSINYQTALMPDGTQVLKLVKLSRQQAILCKFEMICRLDMHCLSASLN